MSPPGSPGKLKRSRTTIAALEAVEKKSKVVQECEIEDLEQRARNIISNAASDGFILVLNLTREWRSMIPLISRSRAGYEPFRMPLVILCVDPPPQSLHNLLSLRDDTKLGWICGNPIVTEDLVRAGVKECTSIACPEPLAEASSGELMAMLDADVLIVNRSLEHLGVRQASVLEFKRTENICLLPRLEELHSVAPSQQQIFSTDNSNETVRELQTTSPSSDVESLTPRKESRDLSSKNIAIAFIKSAIQSLVSSAFSRVGDTSTIKDPLYSYDPRFAAGHIFTTRAIGALLGRAFYTPGTLEVIQSLVNPDEDDDEAIFPWQVAPKDEYVGMAYGDLLHGLVSDPEQPALLIGLFRDGGTCRHHLGYVWTNPGYNTIVLKTDLLYVLGDRYFGRSAYAEGILR